MGILWTWSWGWWCSVAKSCQTLCNPMDCSTPDFPVPPTSWSSPKFMSIESVMPSNHLILCRPLLLLPLNFPGNQGLFQWVSHLHQVAKIFELQIQHQSFQWIFRTGWFVIFAVQGTFKSLLQHHSSEASVLRCSAFFVIQLSRPYTTTGKTIILTIWTSVSKVMSAF